VTVRPASRWEHVAGGAYTTRVVNSVVIAASAVGNFLRSAAVEDLFMLDDPGPARTITSCRSGLPRPFGGRPSP
jgi:hypothetical protein